MNEQVALLNFREINMEYLFRHDGAKIQTYSSDESDALRITLRKIFGRLDADHFISLRSHLGLAYRAARGFLADTNSSIEFWTQLSEKIQNEFAASKQYLDESAAQIVEQILIDIQRVMDKHDDPLGQALVDVSTGSDIMILLERPEFNEYVRGWIDSQDFVNQVELVQDFHSLSKIPATAKTLIILGAPRTFTEVQLRTLMFGGFSAELIFLTPDWWLGDHEVGFTSKLFPGIDSDARISFTRTGDQYKQTTINEPPIAGLDFVSASETPEIEEFQQNGDVECRLLHLAGELSLPIEVDAKLVSTLQIRDDGTFVVTRKDPFRDLISGEVILELATSAESDFLWDMAAEELGESFIAYQECREEWLQALRKKKVELGGWHLKKALVSAGVSTGHHVLEWLEESSFTRPRKTSDFEALLRFLEIDPLRMVEVLRLTKLFRSKLSALGQQARESLAQEVTYEDWQAVNSGEVRSILLGDFGDAKFELAQYSHLGDAFMLVSQTQVRKVLRGVPRG
jgi:hypothetical protein